MHWLTRAPNMNPVGLVYDIQVNVGERLVARRRNPKGFLLCGQFSPDGGDTRCPRSILSVDLLTVKMIINADR